MKFDNYKINAESFVMTIKYPNDKNRYIYNLNKQFDNNMSTRKRKTKSFQFSDIE